MPFFCLLIQWGSAVVIIFTNFWTKMPTKSMDKLSFFKIPFCDVTFCLQTPTVRGEWEPGGGRGRAPRGRRRAGDQGVTPEGAELEVTHPMVTMLLLPSTRFNSFLCKVLLYHWLNTGIGRKNETDYHLYSFK